MKQPDEKELETRRKAQEKIRAYWTPARRAEAREKAKLLWQARKDKK